MLSALRSEMQLILSKLEKQKTWLSQLRNELGINTYNRFSNIRFPRAIYDNHLPVIFSSMDSEDLRLLHLGYSYLSIIDDTLGDFDSIVDQSKRSYVEYQRYAGAQMRVDELQRVGQLARDIFEHHLTGTKLQFQHSDTPLA